MDGSGPPALAFAITGPIRREDLAPLCERVHTLLATSEPGALLECELHGVEPDAVTVDALARLQLAARRHGCTVRLHGGSQELCGLVSFMGLEDVLCVGGQTSNRRQAEA
jgi:ABC-type transporter Mla MlaB component